MDQNEQIEIAGRLQQKVLERFETLLDEGAINATEMATLVRLLVHNGWILDKARIPQGLQDKLTAGIDPSTITDDDILPFRKHG